MDFDWKNAIIWNTHYLIIHIYYANDEEKTEHKK